MLHIFTVCHPFKIFEAIVLLVAVDMIDFGLVVGIRNKGLGDEHMKNKILLFAVLLRYGVCNFSMP